MPESSSQVPILELRGVSKRFGAVQALSNVNFEVYAGEVVGLVGDNGAGKSTLIKCVAGIHPIDDGEIWFEGQKSPHPKSNRRNEFGNPNGLSGFSPV